MTKSDSTTVLSTLRQHSFRILFASRLLVSAGLQMRMVARGWLVYELTESALALTWVATARSLAVFFFAPIGGVLTDRLDKRKVIMYGRLLMTINSGCIAALVLTGHIELWHLAVSSVVDGFRASFTMPANNSIVADLVPRDSLLNAFSVLAVGGSLLGIVGAGAAGILIEWVGPGRVFVLMAIVFAVVGLMQMLLPEAHATRTGQQQAIWREWILGVKHVWARPTLTLLMALTFTRMCLVQPYTTLLPAYASDVLNMSASGLGWLTSARLLGAMGFSLLITAKSQRQQPGRLMLLSMLLVGASLLLFVSIPWAPAAFVLIAIVGGANQATMIMSKTLMQTEAEPEFRGRVTSLRQNLDGLAPAVRLPAGMLADTIGVAPVVAIQASLVIALSSLVWWKKPAFRSSEKEPRPA